MSRIIWSYGVTTVPSRRGDLLPRTLASLRGAGFERPHLFVDGDTDGRSWSKEFSLDVTVRYPTIRVAGHWTLSLYELYIRRPDAQRFALFQDDLVTYHNLRSYLEQCPCPEHGYWNLYTFPSNQALCPKQEGKEVEGWYLSNQFGRGAVALMFSREAVTTLLAQPHLVHRPQDCHRGHRAIDGGVVEAMKKAGWQEWVHHPSLVQHTGFVSSMGNSPHLQATSFRGEEYDARSLLPPPPNA